MVKDALVTIKTIDDNWRMGNYVDLKLFSKSIFTYDEIEFISSDFNAESNSIVLYLRNTMNYQVQIIKESFKPCELTKIASTLFNNYEGSEAFEIKFGV